MAGQFHAPSHPGVLKNVNMNGNILQRYFTISEVKQRSLGVPIIVANIHWRKTVISSLDFLPTLNFSQVLLQ